MTDLAVHVQYSPGVVHLTIKGHTATLSPEGLVALQRKLVAALRLATAPVKVYDR